MGRVEKEMKQHMKYKITSVNTNKLFFFNFKIKQLYWAHNSVSLNELYVGKCLN